MTFRDRNNQATVNRLVREVRALNPGFLTQDIRGVYTVDKVKGYIARVTCTDGNY